LEFWLFPFQSAEVNDEHIKRAIPPRHVYDAETVSGQVEPKYAGALIRGAKDRSVTYKHNEGTDFNSRKKNHIYFRKADFVRFPVF
jgi:hypothetical protein